MRKVTTLGFLLWRTPSGDQHRNEIHRLSTQKDHLEIIEETRPGGLQDRGRCDGRGRIRIFHNTQDGRRGVAFNINETTFQLNDRARLFNREPQNVSNELEENQIGICRYT